MVRLESRDEKIWFKPGMNVPADQRAPGMRATRTSQSAMSGLPSPFEGTSLAVLIGRETWLKKAGMPGMPGEFQPFISDSVSLHGFSRLPSPPGHSSASSKRLVLDYKSSQWAETFTMKLLLSLLAVAYSLLSTTSASPFPQAVTDIISPTGGPPEGCSTSHPNIFGIAAFRLPSAPDTTPEHQQKIAPREDCTTPTVTVTAAPNSLNPTSTPALPQGTVIPISQIRDGQVQAPPQPAALIPPPPPAALPAANDQQDAFPDLFPVSSPTTTTTTTTTLTTPSTSTPTSPSNTTPPRLSACLTPSTLLLHLSSSLLLDTSNRTGYIASNYQFQFDAPPQSGSIYTAGWSVCGNGSLALGASARFWQCRNGGFFNLYDRGWAEQCEEVRLVILEAGGMGECEGIWE